MPPAVHATAVATRSVAVCLFMALFLQDASGLTSNSIPAAISCPYCGTVVSSRNKLYAHLRSSTQCGEQAVAVDGLDLEAGRPQATRKIALTFGYTACSNERAVARLRDAAPFVAVDDERPGSPALYLDAMIVAVGKLPLCFGPPL